MADAAPAPSSQSASPATVTTNEVPGDNNGSISSTPVSVTASPQGGVETTPVLSGIALGMSECEAVRRAGRPSQVTITAGEQGERKVVLTYAGGSWPGIYTFNGGRLKVVDAVTVPEKPKTVAKTKKTPQRAQSATRQGPSSFAAQQPSPIVVR